MHQWIATNAKLKEKGTSRECKQHLRREKEDLLPRIKLKQEERNNAEKEIEYKKSVLSECRALESTA